MSSRVASERISCPILTIVMLVLISEYRGTTGPPGTKHNNGRKAQDTFFFMEVLDFSLFSLWMC